MEKRVFTEFQCMQFLVSEDEGACVVQEVVSDGEDEIVDDIVTDDKDVIERWLREKDYCEKTIEEVMGSLEC